jgi:DNA-binding response OmpR family regulator
MRALVIEDDLPLSKFIRKHLEGSQYSVEIASDGEQGLQLARDREFSLVVLDLNLPKIDGLSVLKGLRPVRPSVPVLVLTARNKIEDRVAALDSGADDCLVKPFSYSELSARIRALLRRNPENPQPGFQVADLIMHPLEMRVERAGRRIELSAKEYALLEFLMRHKHRPVTRAMIMQEVWDIGFDPGNNIVDVYIRYLRNKIDANHFVKLIHTVRGTGYVLTDK